MIFFKYSSVPTVVLFTPVVVGTTILFLFYIFASITCTWGRLFVFLPFAPANITPIHLFYHLSDYPVYYYFTRFHDNIVIVSSLDTRTNNLHLFSLVFLAMTPETSSYVFLTLSNRVKPHQSTLAFSFLQLSFLFPIFFF